MGGGGLAGGGLARAELGGLGARRWVRAEVGEGAGAGEGSGRVEEGDASGHGAAFAEVSAHL